MLAKVAIIRGGKDTDRYHTSIKTGAYVMQSLPDNEYEIYDVLIDKYENWFINGMKDKPINIVDKVDAVLDFSRNKDAKITPSAIVKLSNKVYIGPNKSSVLFTRNKYHTKQVAQELVNEFKINIPKSIVVDPANVYETESIANNVFKQFSPPYIIKPVTGSLSEKIYYVPSLQDLPKTLEVALRYGEPVFIEEYVFGKDISMVFLKNIRGKDIYPLPAVYIEKTDKFLTTSDKLKPKIEVPTNILSDRLKSKIEKFGENMWYKLNISYYAKFDFKLDSYGRLFFMEANAILSFFKDSVAEASMNALGIDVGDLFHHYLSCELLNKNIL